MFKCWSVEKERKRDEQQARLAAIVGVCEVSTRRYVLMMLFVAVWRRVSRGNSTSELEARMLTPGAEMDAARCRWVGRSERCDGRSQEEAW